MDTSTYTVVSFPRSGNNYLTSLMGLAFPDVKYKATHSAVGLTLNNPITLIRKPNECIPSWIAFYPKPESFENRLPKVIAWYERFHSQLLNSKSKVFCFYQAITKINEFTLSLETFMNQKSKSFDNDKIWTNKNHTSYEYLSENDFRLTNCFNLYNQIQTNLVKLI